MLLSWNFLSGWALVAVALVAFPFALPWPRRAPWLRDTAAGRLLNSPAGFFVTHQILIFVFLPLLLLHSVCFTPGFHMTPLDQLKGNKLVYYICVPVAIYVFERVRRMARASRLAPAQAARIEGGVLELVLRRVCGFPAAWLGFGDDGLCLLADSTQGSLPGRILQFTKTKPAQSDRRKPRGFRSTPGQYVYLCVPDVAGQEWHPFTITSAPQDPFLSLHIKDVNVVAGRCFHSCSPPPLFNPTQLEKNDPLPMQPSPPTLARLATGPAPFTKPSSSLGPP
jgi:hypothetical protein